ncbi:lipoyltransferase 1, mitochondrial-like [Mytilus californianus]|uniref:lipoyltransferase 1, mitochondrial-like n=1 Tax=Mytilus californianus TaxID=6549 RepID=UPI00224535E3|nr:lipoyltransferase 1, mitochondrial-like [Mytilus californianus]
MVTRYIKIKLQFCQQLHTWNHLTCLRKHYTTKSGDLVFVSLSNDIFMNLAFEDWLYENENLKTKSILLMWKNNPAVVIGCHQNPYLECDVWKIAENNLSLARRKSGGGAVYHDKGNINCSFIKDRSLYNRYKNLDLVVKALSSRWNIDLSINTREDILLDGFYKVSGTASKLGRNTTYHHFTLIFDVDKDKLFEYLDSPMSTVGVHSRATQSLKSRVKNLSDSIPGVTYDSLVDVIGQQFLKGKKNMDNFQFINPSEAQFPGLQKIYNELFDWEWIYGRTPNFSLTRHFAKNLEYYIEHQITINVNIEKGRISKIDIETNFNETYLKMRPLIQEHLIGTRFWFNDLQMSLNKIKQESRHFGEIELHSWIGNCLSKVLCV